jgi:CheY-like chemotaxis protein
LDSKSRKEKDSETELLERELFGTDITAKESDESDHAHYVIDDAYQGNEAINMVEKAAEEGLPYALIFMDVRMPPGIDGIQAITEIWKQHPLIEMVICTAYSDYSWDQIVSQFGSTDHLLFMKKPFDSIALKQMALSLTTKWDLAKQNAKYVEKLEVEIQQRTRQLNEMGEHLKKIKRDTEKLTLAKSNFFSTKTSELQSPLNGILGITDLLLDTELSEEQRSFAETIKLSGSSLLLVVNDILDFSKTDSPGSEFEEIVFDLRTTLESVVDLVSVAAVEKEVEITCFIDCTVRELFIGDPFKLRQILLLSFTHIIKTVEACEIVLVVSNNKTETDKEAEILFEISKLGKVTNDFLEKKPIFQGKNLNLLTSIETGNRFPRQDQVEELVKQIGGEFFSNPDPESETTIRFTGNFGVSSPTFPSVVLSSTIIGMRCLVVSDYAIGRKVLSLHIDHWGGICKEAFYRDNVVEKINLAKESNLPFDAVIIDLKNEPQEKFESIAKDILDSCKKRKVKAPRLICLTANAKRGDALLFGEYGYSVYLTKPIKQSQLYKSLLLVKSLKDENQFLDPATLITKHFVDEFTPDYYKVLVVDQNPQNLKMIITCLTRLKVRCDVADSRKIVSSVLKEHKYDLVLIDCKDCDDQDFEMLNSIKSAYPKLKSVLMIDSDNNNAKQAFEEGVVSDSLPKPVSNENLISMLRKNLSS